MSPMLAVTQEQVVTLIVALGAGGVFAAIIRAFPRSPEARKNTIELAEGAVLVQSGVIQALRDELDRLTKRVDAYERERGELRVALANALSDKDVLERKNRELTTRVKHLEEDLAELRRQTGVIDERST